MPQEELDLATNARLGTEAGLVLSLPDGGDAYADGDADADADADDQKHELGNICIPVLLL